MDQDNNSCSFLFIDGDSTLNVAGIETFGKKVKLAECGLPYGAISIMGPQSSGKSTLLNHLFGTNFREMDAHNTRGQTTQGIWLAKYPDVKHSTLVMDLEGSDGRERGEDDTKFEKQAALFAFAISDIVLINMWAHDVGRVQGSSTPLLRTVFEAMRKLKLGDSKTTLWFVLRDKTTSPMKVLEELLWKDIQQIWDSVAKGTPLSECFKVKITALSNYDFMKEQFKEEVSNLRQQLLGDLAGDGRDKRPSSEFSFSVKDLWEKIKENKDLDLPAHKIMVATVKCEEIANNTFVCLVEDNGWHQLQSDVLSAPVNDFGKDLSLILDKHLSGYDAQTMYYDEGVRTEKRRQLKDKMLQLVEPAHETMLEHIHSRTLNDFKEQFPKEFIRQQVFLEDARDYTKRFMTMFDAQCRDAAIDPVNWGSSKLRDRLQRDIDAHVAAVHSHAMSEYLKCDKERLEELLSRGVAKLLVKAADGTWQEIRELFQHGIQSSFFNTFSDNLDEQTRDKNLKELDEYTRRVIYAKSRQEADRVQTQMEKRFERFFSHDDSNNLRVWTGEEDIQAIRNTARTTSLEILSTMAAVRLDDDVDDIKKTLFSALIDNNESAKDSLDSDTWEKVPLEKTLIKPVECKERWDKFNTSSEVIISQAQELITCKRYESFEPWGGSGGSQWIYKPKGHITQIVLKIGGTIESITFKHYDDNNNSSVENKFGGNGGGQVITININSPSEYLTSIGGTMDIYRAKFFVVRSLCFVTNLNKHGPFGTQTGTAFSMPTLEGVAIVGFHGRSGIYIDSIGVYLKPISTEPIISERYKSFGPSGGLGGDKWTYNPESHITCIVLKMGDTIDSITFKHYNNKNSNLAECKFGGSGGARTVTINIISPSEYLTSISGTTGFYEGCFIVRSLSFVTNLNKYGPFGTNVGNAFSMPTLEGAEIIGFHGRSGKYLDSIGVYLKSIPTEPHQG